MLPPKRDLPFLKPSQKRSQGGDTATSLPSRSASTNQPLIEPSNDEQLLPLAGHETMSMPRDFQISDSQSQSQSQSLVPTQPLLDIVQMEPLPSQSQVSQPDSYPNLDPVSEQARIRTGHERVASVKCGLGGVSNSNSIAQRELTQSATLSENQLSAYLGAPTPERIAFLENWMCELIEDDGFMALCQDVEVIWRRFAFGDRK